MGVRGWEDGGLGESGKTGKRKNRKAEKRKIRKEGHAPPDDPPQFSAFPLFRFFALEHRRFVEGAGVVEHLIDAVVGVGDDDGGGVVVERLLGQQAVGQDDDLVPDLGQPRRRAVDADDPAAGVAADHVRLEPGPVVQVQHPDRLVGAQAGHGQQVGVDRDRPDVVQITLRHRRPVNLGTHQLA